MNMGSGNGVANDRRKTNSQWRRMKVQGMFTDNMVCSIVVPLRGVLLNAFIMQNVSAKIRDALPTPAAAMAKVVAVGKNQVK